MRIEIASEAATRQNLAQLIDLLVNTVNDGASIGWIPPIDKATAADYWQERIPEIGAGNRVLWLAWEGEMLIGSAQLGLEQRENGNHRAEVQKVMVRTDYRRRGIARQLMLALEDYAIHAHRSLLFLDTRQGDPSENLYLNVGYVKAGVIPQYARNENGDLVATVIYYKILR